MATEIILPRVFREIGFNSLAEQIPSITATLPKIFAVSAYDEETTASRWQQIYSHTHYGISDGVSAAKKWDTVRWYPGMTAQNVADSVPHDPNFLVMAEIMENRGNAGEANTLGFQEDCFQRIFAATGQADPTNTNIVQDYFDHDGIGQIGLSVLMSSPGSSLFNNWRTRFSSETEARKDRGGVVSNYFSRGAYNWRNWLATGYLDGWHRVPEYTWPYLQIAELEQKHLAIRRKVIQFCWDILEGSEWKIYRMGSLQSIRFETPPGFIYRALLNGVPPEMMYRQAFIDSTIGDGMIHWGPAGRTTHKLERWVRSYNGGPGLDKTRWKADGSNVAVNYNYNDPTQPNKSPGDNPNEYQNQNDIQIIPPSFGGPVPNGAHHALAGRYMADLIKNKYTKIYWPSFSYKINGGSTINGYASGTDPVTGSLGDASLSTLDNRNFGQHNIVNQLEAKKPICWEGSDFIAFCYLMARVNDEIEVNVNGTVIECVGPQWRVFDK